MAAPLRPSCNREELPPELLQLRLQIDQLSWSQQQKLLPLCEKVCQFVGLQARLIRIAQEAVDQLHLDVKYLLFDVEVTRRERDELREELEEQ
jgi:hypothetical protein